MLRAEPGRLHTVTCSVSRATHVAWRQSDEAAAAQWAALYQRAVAHLDDHWWWGRHAAAGLSRCCRQ